MSSAWGQEFPGISVAKGHKPRLDVCALRLLDLLNCSFVLFHLSSENLSGCRDFSYDLNRMHIHREAV